MDPYLSTFLISDLEQFSGIKAHTIRIWERRYGLLKPDRTQTNIRRYDLDELRTILNVAYLNNKGHKISKIAAMSAEKREELVRSESGAAEPGEGLLNTLTLAMLGFDDVLFERSCDAYVQAHGFRSLMEQVLVKLLERIGVLWQTSSICPAQEHFVSNLVRHRIIAATAALQEPRHMDRTHILFLPQDEIHELGLLYACHVLRSHGERAIYLGQSVPRADLAQVVTRLNGELVFVSNFVVQPTREEVPGYLEGLEHEIPEGRCTFLFAAAAASDPNKHPRIKLVPTMRELIAELDANAR